MIETERLILRPWREEDRAACHAMCSDPEVMAFIGAPQSRAESDAAIDRMIVCQAEHGHCFWAIERREDGALLGLCGLLPPRPPLEHVEIGWRLGRTFWGKGYAREAAAASLAWGWRNLATDTIDAITVPANTRSWGLMERLGMHRVAGGDFDHPAVPDGSPLKRHILYRIARC